ncbi:hypothetical protein LSH36_13g01050 [Paralvinella palmiformis]|uniref:Uncharacterized protein n=1 Tax=Paralvinella palmiformis TaxID=53620 RepID=A0AAD9NHW3_9ANNE|nr:hypothetical protein LSH36_13g01050 [Paralvinella palmiformis]
MAGVPSKMIQSWLHQWSSKVKACLWMLWIQAPPTRLLRPLKPRLRIYGYNVCFATDNAKNVQKMRTEIEKEAENSIMRRRPSYDDYREQTRAFKRSRMDYGDRDGYYRDRGRPDRYGGRPARSRYGGVRRETFLNGMAEKTDIALMSYSDYIREFRGAPPVPPPGYGPLPPGFGQPAPPYPYDRPREYPAPAVDYPPPPHSRSSRRETKRSYERDVENFLRHTAHASRERRSERHHDRERERDRGRYYSWTQK